MNDAASIIEQFLKDASSGNLKTRHYPAEFQSLRMKVSFGQGGLAKVPWIAFLKEGQQVQSGIYPVYLFYKEFDCLILAYGVSQNNTPKTSWPHINAMKIGDFLSDKFGANPDNYTDSYVFASYDVKKALNWSVLNNDLDRIIAFYKSLELVGDVPVENVARQIGVLLSKPFLLLAGISGTGKSRFVREQANRSSGEDAPSNYELISVRPDWHEPSDLLGYVSRLGDNAPHFVSTPTLKFMVSAWKNINPAAEELSANRFHNKDAVLPYWLCLDEMNLAPVEQYFADYLSVIETRDWTDGFYRCDPILKADVIKGLSDEGRITLKKDLGLETGFDALWDYFCAQGVPIPYNLIVAGTVNMDETTHGFSRKVIDRALTVDFGEFFPNDFDAFFDGSQKQPIVLSYPTGSEAREETHAAVKSRQFLKDLNESALKGTAFEVAFRALNELLLSVQSFAPYSNDDSAKLQAIWDDFLMMKILPRIEGDRDKVEQVLENLKETLTKQLNDIWSDEPKRPDLWRDTQDLIPCRSKVKIKWMQGRLDKSGFTSFWP